jgi:hypothetical protein
MKTCRLEVKLHMFLNSAIHGGKCLRNGPAPLRTKKVNPVHAEERKCGEEASLNLRFSPCTRYAVVWVRNQVFCVMESIKIVLDKRELRRLFGPQIK